MDTEARNFSEATKQLFIAESKHLFTLNNKIIQSIEGAGKVAAWKAFKWLIIIIIIGFFIYLIMQLFYNIL